MSAEVWRDLIQELCDEAECFDPRMRYQYFLSGLRNREWKTVLSTAMVNSIPQAVAVLLYKNMHIPVEDDADFADMVANTSKSAGAKSALLTQMMQMLQANQNLILQQQRKLAQYPRSPRRSNYAAAAFGNAAPPTQAPSYHQGTPTSVPQGSVRGIRQGPDIVSLEANDEDWNVPVNEEKAEASHTFDYNEETVVNNYDNVEMWNRDDAASAVRYEEGLTTMETTEGERPMAVGYATTTEEYQSNESAIGLTTGNNEEITRKTTVNVCNGVRCRCLEALPVVVERVNFLPSRNAEGNASAAPAEKKTDIKESDSPAEEIGVPFPTTLEYDRNAGPSGLERVSEAFEDGLEEVESTEKSSGVLDDQAEAVAPPGESPPPYTRHFTKEELEALEAKTPSPTGVELEEYDKELEEQLFPLDEVELRERVAKNAAKAKELSLEELSVMLNLPLETLERTREASPGELSMPEYWLDWYRKTLAASAEAKRANRDFRASVPPTKDGARAESGPSRPTEPESADDEVAPVMDEVVASVVSSSRVATTMVDESRVIANICVPRAGSERKDEALHRRFLFRLLRFDCSSLAAGRSEALGSHSGCVEDPDGVLNYVCFVKDGSATKDKRKPGLMERKDRPKPKVDPNNDVEDPVPEGKRIICSVEGYEATSVGFIDSLPAELFIDTGAIASLVDSRVLEKVGLAKAPLRPYHGSLNGVSGQPLHIRGEIELPLRIGTLEKLRTLAVVDCLHVHALLGTDALKAFRAVVDMGENVMTLKETGETIRLGTPRVEEAILRCWLKDCLELDPLLKIARSLCSVRNGQTIVEVCNASEEEIVIQKGTVLAAATIVPKSAFLPVQQAHQSLSGTLDVDTVISPAAKEPNPSREKMPGLKEAYRAEMEADFTDSKLGREQQELLRSLLGDFRDMFAESSLKPGRTDLLKFSIDTGTHPSIKQWSYRVSNAEGDVMEAEIDQYLELGLVRPSTSPWASPDLLNDDSSPPGEALDEAVRAALDALDEFGEPSASPPFVNPRADAVDDAPGDFADADDDELPVDAVVQTASFSVDLFGLDWERFQEEQKRPPWIQVLIAFLEDGTLALDAQLRVKVLLMAPHYVVKNGMLMRRVHLKARGGPARSLSVPVIPLPLSRPYFTTATPTSLLRMWASPRRRRRFESMPIGTDGRRT
ncbi:unnamed protein product [Phytophthora fragariaefolia]|uniref:Unnamed protein product n=1 Tax=Phytophthora fragariaefolia TaxID=1490495 RepID=A0A9W6UF35_9STRA|nr:unnamed protein product [Phytophthora fragariaefolia]